MLNWQTTQFLRREELRETLNGIEKDQGVIIEQVVILERWQEDSSSAAYYLALYRLADFQNRNYKPPIDVLVDVAGV